MGIKNLSDLNKFRRNDKRKDPSQEDYLLNLNRYLQQKEARNYLDITESIHPYIFVYGLPRSGTTVLAQFLAKCFDVGYINNFMARFWLSPVTGIRLSKIIQGDKRNISLESEYATTNDPHDIHEFGYFWRHWLKKDTIDDHLNISEVEKNINWQDLKKVLLNIQHTFEKGIVMKNIFGAYHIERMSTLFNQILFVYIERDPLDNAISILEARKKFFDDLSLWWSIIPLEYNELKNIPYMKQIAGQVFYLRKFYNESIQKLNGENIIKITYEDLCHNPGKVIDMIKDHFITRWNYDLNVINKPDKLPFKVYKEKVLKKEFETLLTKFK